LNFDTRLSVKILSLFEERERRIESGNRASTLSQSTGNCPRSSSQIEGTVCCGDNPVFEEAPKKAIWETDAVAGVVGSRSSEINSHLASLGQHEAN
jgi:hypothetical protein